MADILKTNMTRNALSAVSFTAANPSSTVETGADDRMVLSVRNTQTEVKTLTIKAGNALQGVSDLVVSVPASTAGLIQVESGKYVQVSGANTGRILVEAEAGHRTGLLRSALTERTRAGGKPPASIPGKEERNV